MPLHVIFLILADHDPLFCAVLLMCFVISILTGLFLAYHLHLIREGYTSNEKIKISEIVKDTTDTVKFLEKYIETDDDLPQDDCDYYGVKGDETESELSEMLIEAKEDLYRAR